MWLRRAPETPMTLYGKDYASQRERLHIGMTNAEVEAAEAEEAAKRKSDLQKEIARGGREAAARFEHGKATWMFVETRGGGWVRVDGYRLKAGPRDGEIWHTFDEMQRISAERKELAGAAAERSAASTDDPAD